jgi:hypothetical protein
MYNARTAVFILIFANLVFMAWAHWIDVPREVPVSQADARLPRLVLASEAPARPSATPQPPATSTTAAPSEIFATAATANSQRCVSVGPFSDFAQQTHAASVLQTRGFSPQQRTEQGDVRDGYWVFVGGIKSAADEARALRTLQDAGIVDAHATATADDGRRVSVGLFMERPRAERRARAVQHLGFSPDIVERRRPSTVYWVDLNLGSADVPVSTEGLASSDDGGSQIQVRACPST